MNKILLSSMNNLLEAAGATYTPVSEENLTVELAIFADLIRSKQLNLQRISFAKEPGIVIFACSPPLELKK